MAESHGEFRHDYTCQEVVALASDYLGGALKATELTAIELHLNFCDGCSTFVDQIGTTAAIARRMTVEQISEETMEKLMAAFRERRP
jgi:predicted anti-sigma-YlaC factor YlaD